jgi:hypothetical protein
MKNMKKKIIRINAENLEELTAELEKVQHRARVRTITAAEVVKACEKYEKRLGITKKAMQGIKITVDINAEDFPNAYKYAPESTVFTAEYARDGWRLVSVQRDYCHRWSNAINANLTEAAKAAIISKFETLSAGAV